MLSKYIIYGLSGLLVLLLVVDGIRTLRLKKVRADLLKTQNFVVELQAAVKQRDAVIEETAAKGRETLQRVEAAKVQAEKGRIQAQKRVDELIAAKVPTNPVEQVEYLYELAGKLNGEWEAGK